MSEQDKSLEIFEFGYKAAECDIYWERYGFEMHHARELECCRKAIADRKATPYHHGYVSKSSEAWR